jgi:O-antigen ligase
LIDLNQTGQLPRLQQPLGYWNALALFLVLAVPIVLALAVDMERARRTRSVGLVTLQLMLLTIGLTYSRGGLIALVVALVIAVGLSGVRLRSLMWLGIAALAAIAPLVFGLTSHSLTTVRSSLASRESAGLILLLILLASITGLLIAARSLHDLEARRRLSPAQARGIGKVLVGVSVVLLAAGVLALALSARGLGGSVSHAWHTFTATRVTSNYDPGRLLSADSENRWVWWKEAAGAFSDRPLTGWGAGSFPVVHLLYRHNRLSVNQPHSVPLQFLSEIGLPGLLFAAVGFAFLIAQAVRGIRALPVGRGRLVPAALLAGAVAYLVHSLYDWDWNFPALTLPALIFLGVLAAHRPRGVTASRSSATARGVLLATATVCLCLLAISALLPSLAASKSSAALVSASNASADAVQDAQASAQLASSLDPLSDNGLKLEATIALRRGSVAAAVRYLVAAVNRDPSDVEAWQQIAYLESVHGNFPAALRAVRRLLVLDPRGRETNVLVASVVAAANLANAPPAGSATAQPVP